MRHGEKQEHKVCIWFGGAFLCNAHVLSMAAALHGMRHTCWSSPPTGLLIMNSASSQAPSSHPGDTLVLGFMFNTILINRCAVAALEEKKRS